MIQFNIGIGCTTTQDLAAEVLRFSIEPNTKLRPAFIKLHQTPQ